MTENMKKEVAKNAVSYLKNRMIINQTLIKMSDQKIDFDKFISLYSKYIEKIEYTSEHINDSESNTLSKPISFLNSLVRLKNKFLFNTVDYIALTNEEIDELLEFVKESIEKYGLSQSNVTYNETLFIREVLIQLINNKAYQDSSINNEKFERLKMYLLYIQADENIGFCKLLNGNISFRNNEFSISTHELKPVCKVDKDGQNTATMNALENEDILLADKIYVGTLTNDEEHFYVFLEKMIDGQRKVKEISCYLEIYDIFDNSQGKIKTLNKAILFDNINIYFKDRGFEFLTSNIYTESMLFNMLDVYDKMIHMSLDELNELENIIELATSWWIDKISFQKAHNNLISEKRKIQNFKTILGNKIRMMLLSHSMLALVVGDSPVAILEEAIKEAQLDVPFPSKTKMFISKNSIEVVDNLGNNEIIYARRGRSFNE